MLYLYTPEFPYASWPDVLLRGREHYVPKRGT